MWTADDTWGGTAMTEVRTMPQDRIHVRNLRLRTVIGVAEWEQEHRQDVLVNIVLYTDTRRAAKSDKLGDTVDYKELRDRLVRLAENRPHGLLEALAQHIVDLCMENPRVQAVDVTVDKPGALRFSESVAVQIHRSR